MLLVAAVRVEEETSNAIAKEEIAPTTNHQGVKMKPYYQDEWTTQYCSDALKVLAELPDESIDLLATDPPYGISFMGKDWDKALPDTKIWRECFRVLQAGSLAFVMSIPRADCLSRMIISLEDAGFWVDFTPIFWAYASGFPKAQNIGKVVDKRLGAKRKQVMTTHTDMFGDYQKASQHMSGIGKAFGDEEWESGSEMVESTIPTSPQAKALDGSYGGFQPKPAVEVIIVAMKPLSEKTFVDQALKNRKGISWLDDCRIPYEGKDKPQGGFGDMGIGIGKPSEHQPYTPKKRGSLKSTSGERKYGYKECVEIGSEQGRFPANLLVSDDTLEDGREHRVGDKGREIDSSDKQTMFGGGLHNTGYGDSGSFSRYFDLDKWWAKTFPFLIVPKASKSEKDRYLDTRKYPYEESRKDGGQSVLRNNPDGSVKTYKNYHPTVKPLKLMSYLITLGSREGDIVLDPFMGSGTTALASKFLNRKCIGIEIEEKYCEIAADRCRQMIMDLRCITPPTGATL